MKTNLISAFLLSFSAILLLACGDNANTNVNRTTTNSTMNNTSMSNSTMNMTNSTMNNSAVSNMNTANSNVAVVQDNFWINAAQSGMAEVELGKLAAQKATNAEVKKFAQMMVADHTKANDELKTLAAKNNVKLPTELSSAHKSMLEKLQGLSGAEFDKAYVDGQVDDHETAVDLMEDNAGNSNADIKAFATKSLPVMQSHLKMIQGIQDKMK